jgi:hypothetical protein
MIFRKKVEEELLMCKEKAKVLVRITLTLYNSLIAELYLMKFN